MGLPIGVLIEVKECFERADDLLKSLSDEQIAYLMNEYKESPLYHTRRGMSAMKEMIDEQTADVVEKINKYMECYGDVADRGYRSEILKNLGTKKEIVKGYKVISACIKTKANPYEYKIIWDFDY